MLLAVAVWGKSLFGAPKEFYVTFAKNKTHWKSLHNHILHSWAVWTICIIRSLCPSESCLRKKNSRLRVPRSLSTSRTIPGRDPAQKPLKIWAVWAVFQQDLSGLSGLGGFYGKTAQTAQILLKKPLKNRSFLAVIFERFFKQDLSGFWAAFERSSRVEVPDSTFLFSAKLERTRSSRGDQYVVIFQKVSKNSIFDQLFTSANDVTPSRLTIPPRNPQPRRAPPLSLVRGHLLGYPKTCIYWH